MFRKILFLLFSFLEPVTEAWAAGNQWDYSAALLARTTPIGLTVEGTTGYGIRLWGSSEEGNPFYGYVRPSISVRGPMTVAAKGTLDFYPVSFFGFSAGKIHSTRLIDLPGLDCDVAQCQGGLHNSFWNVRALGKIKDFFAVATYEKSKYDDVTDSTRPVAEGTHVVFLNPKNESASHWITTAGYQYSDQIAAGVLAHEFKTDESKERQEAQVLFGRYVRGEFAYAVGLGRFYSTQFGTGPLATLGVTWTGAKRIGP